MFDLKTLLPMAKPALEKEGLKSIVVRLHDGEESGIEICKFSKDIIEHVQVQSAYIIQLEKQKDELNAIATNRDIAITGIAEILNSRKSSDNKIKAIAKLINE